MSGQVLVCCPECGSTNIVRHISGEFECLSCGYKWGEGRRYGHPRTEEERRERHKERYGTEELPPRGTARLWEKKRRVKAEEIPLTTPAFLSKVKRAYESGETTTYWEWIIEPSPLYDGVFTYLRDDELVRFFPGELIRKMEYNEEERCYVIKEET